jgi:hypothetical protein
VILPQVLLPECSNPNDSLVVDIGRFRFWRVPSGDPTVPDVFWRGAWMDRMDEDEVFEVSTVPLFRMSSLAWSFPSRWRDQYRHSRST